VSIIQISKIQQRAGNLVDLPQLDDAELGWASDAKRLFIGKSTPNENIEVLTSYSTISFSQIDGSEGNLNITAVSNGEILSYDGVNWVNKGGAAGGYINLGNVANVTLSGGAIGYVLQTDGTGNLSWTPKGTLYTNIIALSNATPIVMTVANTTPYTNGQAITISGANGVANANVNGLTFYLTLSNDFASSGNVNLYTDSGRTANSNGTSLTYTNTPNAIATATIGSGGGGAAAGGANTSIQYNNGGIVVGDSSLTWSGSLLTVTGSANISSNVNVTGNVTASRLISNIAIGTAPFVVTSTTQVANLNVATAGLATYATTANAVAGANVSGTVANAAYANLAGFATTANAVAGANVSGAVSYATTANAVAGANVSGAVSYATTANAVAGANVSGTVANATYSVSSGSATTAATVTTAAQPNITSVGTLTGLTLTATTGTLTVPIITTGANTTAGTLTGNWSLSTGSKLQATYADLAEYYTSDQIYEPGTVLEFGGEQEVTIGTDETTRVAGVVSTNPAYIMNSLCLGTHTVAIALQGRVPCKVRGKIHKGDMLISGGNGYARPTRATPMIGTVIGKALENFEGEGTIEVAISRM